MQVFAQSKSCPKALSAEILERMSVASKRVYRFGGITSVQSMPHPAGGAFTLKREDLSSIHSYKWRGACNKVCSILEQNPTRPIIAASAGNHAMGVILASARSRASVTIVVPTSAPKVKLDALRRYAGEYVSIVIHGEEFSEAHVYARTLAERSGAAMIEPFDDLDVIAGQATIGRELSEQVPLGSTIYVPVGGGGLAAGLACTLKERDPSAKVIGVEADGQACMRTAFDAGEPVPLASTDRFCDGTAVRTAGSVTYPLCKELLDDLITVSNDEVARAIAYAWNVGRVMPEPSGALSLAAILRLTSLEEIARSVAVVTGANVDFASLSSIAQR